MAPALMPCLHMAGTNFLDVLASHQALPSTLPFASARSVASIIALWSSRSALLRASAACLPLICGGELKANNVLFCSSRRQRRNGVFKLLLGLIV